MLSLASWTSAACTLFVVAGFVYAFSYNYNAGLFQSGTHLKLVERVNIFCSTAGNLPLATVLLLAVVATAMAVPRLTPGERLQRVADAALFLAAALAALLCLADAAECVALISGSLERAAYAASISSSFPTPPSQVGGVFEYLAPLLISLGAVYYAVRLLVDSSDHDGEEIHDDGEGEYDNEEP